MGTKTNHKVNNIYYKACSSSEEEVEYVGGTKPVQLVNPEATEEQLSASSGAAQSRSSSVAVRPEVRR